MNTLDPAVQLMAKLVENVAKQNHFESVCQSGKKTRMKRPQRVRTLSDTKDYDSDEFF